MEEDVNNQDLGEIINANLKKGVVYRYFISKVNNQVSGKARSGIESLKESYDSFWDSRLFVTEINSQLIAPDIDIIIYNATDVATKREGYTCVEIGNNSDTYVYQRLDGQIVGEIYTKLDPTNNHKKRRKKSLGLSKKIKNLLQILYWLCSVGVFAVLGLNKVASIKVILASIIPALIILALVITVIELIDVIFEKSSEKMSCVELDNKIMMDVLNERGLKAKLADLISAQEQNVFSRFNIGTADKIIQLNDKCELIWILTDLSHDIAFTDFNSWLEKQLNMYDQLKCNILHTLQTPAKGLIRTAESFQRKFRDRIYRGEIKIIQNIIFGLKHME